MIYNCIVVLKGLLVSYLEFNDNVIGIFIRMKIEWCDFIVKLI